MQELRAIDVVSSYRNFVRMNAVTFKTLLNMVAHLIFRKDTNMREAIPPGESYRSQSYLYRIPAQTIGQIVPEVCNAIVHALHGFLKVPRTKQEWINVSKQFQE